MDALAPEDHTSLATREERARYRSMWTLQLNDPNSRPLAFRHDFEAAVTKRITSTRTLRTTLDLFSTQDQDRQRRRCQFSDTYRQILKIDPTTGWSSGSSSSSWWKSHAWDQWQFHDSKFVAENLGKIQQSQQCPVPSILCSSTEGKHSDHERRNTDLV